MKNGERGTCALCELGWHLLLHPCLGAVAFCEGSTEEGAHWGAALPWRSGQAALLWEGRAPAELPCLSRISLSGQDGTEGNQIIVLRSISHFSRMAWQGDLKNGNEL